MTMEGAESVFSFVRNTANTQGDGVHWTTFSTKDKPCIEPGAYRGTSGICFFLSDYYRVTGSKEAKSLAKAGLIWSSFPLRESSLVDLGTGQAGIGMAWLSYFEATEPQV